MSATVTAAVSEDRPPRQRPAEPRAQRDARRGETAPLNVPITAAFIGLLLMREGVWAEESNADAPTGAAAGDGTAMPPAGVRPTGADAESAHGDGAQLALAGAAGPAARAGEGDAPGPRLVQRGEASLSGAGDNVFQLGGEGRPIDVTLEGLQINGMPMAFALGGPPPAQPELASEEASFFEGAGYLAQVEDVQIGSDGDDTLTGTDGNDFIAGGDGDDTIDGRAGDDTLHGDDGDDTVDGGAGHDNVHGDGGDDDLDGGDGSDLVHGGTGDDTLQGGDSADWGFDNLYGGFGSDSYVVNHLSDIPDESWVADDGIDDFRVSKSFIDDFTGTKPYFTAADSFPALPSQVAAGDHVHVARGLENIFVEGDWDADIYGGGGDNVLVGNAGANTIKGFAGDDVLDGRGGTNRLEGGVGADTYLVETGLDGFDTIADADGPDALTANTLRLKGVDRADVAIARDGDAVTFTIDEVLRARIEGYDADGPVFHVETDDARFDLLGLDHAPRRGAELVDEWAVAEGGVGQYALPEDLFVDVDLDDTVTIDARLADGAALPSWLSFDADGGRFVAAPGYEAAGTYQVVVTGTDGRGATASDGFELEVTDVNRAPDSLWRDADVVFAEGAAAQPTYELARYFRDGDAGDTLGFSMATRSGEPVPEWLTLDATTGILSGRPEAPLDAPLELVVTARDGTGAEASIGLTVGVEPATAEAPLAGADVAVTVEDGSVGGDVLANDGHPKSDPLTAALTRGPSDGTVELADDGRFTYTPDADFAGQDVFWYRAVDPDGATSAETAVTVVVAPVNDGPAVAAEALTELNATIAGLDLREGQTAVAPISAAIFTDVDDAAASLAYSARLGAPDGPRLATPTAEVGGWLRFDPTSRSFHLAPGANDGGAHEVFLTARDAGGLAETVAVTFNVAADNQAPTKDGLPPLQDVPAGAERIGEVMPDAAPSHVVAFAVSDHFSDPDDGDALTVNVARADAPDAALDWVRVVQDGDAARIELRPGLAQAEAFGDRPVTLEVWAEDDAGRASEPTTLVYHVAPLPDLLDGVELSDAQHPAEDDAFALQLTGRFASDPTAEVTAALAGGGALPDWLTFEPATGTFSGTPAEADVAAVVVEVVAADAAGHRDVETFTLEVQDTPDPAALNPSAAADFVAAFDGASQGQPLAIVPPADLFVDPDGGRVRIELDASRLPESGWLREDGATGRLYGTPGNADVGEVTLRYRGEEIGPGQTVVTDWWSVTFEVANVNDAPVVRDGAAIDDRAIALGDAFAPLEVAALFDDPDLAHGDRLAYVATTDGAEGLPEGLSLADGELVGTPAEAGAYDIAIAATDAEGSQSAAITFRLDVAAPVVADDPLALGSDGQLATTDFAGVSFATHLWPMSSGTLFLPEGVDAEEARDWAGLDNASFARTGSFADYEHVWLRGDGDGAVAMGDAANVVLGNDGYNVIYGGAGADTLYGAGGDDALYGGDGADILVSGTGSNALHGGAGDDRYEIGGHGQVSLREGDLDTVFDADGANLVDVDGVTADRMSFGMDGADLVIAVDGDDAVGVRDFDTSEASFDVQLDDGGVSNAALLAAVEEMRTAFESGDRTPLADVLDGYMGDAQAAMSNPDPIAAFAAAGAGGSDAATVSGAPDGPSAAWDEAPGTFVTPDGTTGSTQAAAAGLAHKPALEEDPAYA